MQCSSRIRPLKVMVQCIQCQSSCCLSHPASDCSSGYALMLSNIRKFLLSRGHGRSGAADMGQEEL